jgi:hypothetical protein
MTLENKRSVEVECLVMMAIREILENLGDLVAVTRAWKEWSEIHAIIEWRVLSFFMPSGGRYIDLGISMGEDMGTTVVL